MNKTNIVQSIIFDKTKWDIDTSYKWLKDHGYKTVKVDLNYRPEFLSWRQINPSIAKKEGFSHYFTKNLDNGIKIIIAYKGE